MPRQSSLRFTVAASVGNFEVVAFSLDEGLSTPFCLQLELASHDPAIDFAEILDHPLRGCLQNRRTKARQGEIERKSAIYTE